MAGNNRQAVILAGGKGTRLHPYTTILPKPLVPVGEQPILEIIVRQLRSHGFSRLTLAVNHLAELIRAFFADGGKWDVTIRYSLEQKPLGTAGPLGLIDDVSSSFLVMNGDILTDIDYGALWRAHVESGAIATMATCIKKVPISLGVLEVDHGGDLREYDEKPTLQYRVSMGMYVFQRRIKDYIAFDEYLDLPDLMRLLVARGERVHCYDFNGRWLDIGNPDDCAAANAEIAADPSVFLKVPAHL
jgi:NDP-sugar pyrophosphorylase family protein